MKILLSNDDGYYSKGLTGLAESLRQFADVTVVALSLIHISEPTRPY